MTSTPSVTVDSITVLRNGIFLVASQEIICNSGRQQTKSLTKILDENALEYLASRKGFILDRLRLDILTIIFTRIDVTPKSWTVYLICFDVVSCIVQDSCRA